MWNCELLDISISSRSSAVKYILKVWLQFGVPQEHIIFWQNSYCFEVCVAHMEEKMSHTSLY